MFTSALRKVIPTFGYGDISALAYAAVAASRFTPDIAELEEAAWRHIFVVDGLKRDHIMHHLLGPDAVFRFPAYTQDSFLFWESDTPFDHRVPMKARLGEANIHGFPPIAKIKGEVFRIRPQRFLKLDEEYQNTIEFNRTKIKLIVPHRQVQWLKDRSRDPERNEQDLYHHAGGAMKTTIESICIVRAFMYIGKPEFYEPMLTPFDWHPVEYYHSEKRRWADTYYNIRRPKPPELP